MTSHAHYHRDRHGRPLPPSGPVQLSPPLQAALAEAAEFVGQCLRDGRLIKSSEAMALAGREAREKETLYAIARRFAQDRDVDLADLLHALEQRFPDHT